MLIVVLWKRKYWASRFRVSEERAPPMGHIQKTCFQISRKHDEHDLWRLEKWTVGYGIKEYSEGVVWRWKWTERGCDCGSWFYWKMVTNFIFSYSANYVIVQIQQNWFGWSCIIFWICFHIWTRLWKKNLIKASYTVKNVI